MLLHAITRRVHMAVFLVGAMMLVSSCSSKKATLPYFRDITAQTEIVELPPLEPLEIAPNDELYITVTSTNAAATAHFNLPASNPATQSELLAYTSPRQMTYIVNTEGNIDFPQLGDIHVAGLTTEQLQKKLTTEISRWVENPVVNVRLMNYRVSVLGEVARPGAQLINNNRYTILDAIASAGDLTPYGERENVLLIREKDGKQIRVLLDLTSSELLTSEYYYLQPNDYIYVKPNKVREGNAKYDSNKSYNLSMVSTIVSAASVIASLVIALTVK